MMFYLPAEQSGQRWICVLIDRKSSRQLPIQPDYCGKAIDSIISETVKVKWDREEVVIF
jgi:pyrimidine operon attenuation protein/uracil phosphoribosyltransferase